MPRIQPTGGTQRKAHTMEADGIVLPPALEHGQGRTTFAEKIFGMNFEEIKGRLALDQLSVMRMSPANADTVPGNP